MVQFQYCELSPISKLKDRLAKNQRSAKQVAFACVVVHVPLLTWTIARSCGVEPVSMSGAIWRGSFWFANLILQAVAMGIFNAAGRKEGSSQPSSLHQNGESSAVANENDEDGKPQN